MILSVQLNELLQMYTVWYQRHNQYTNAQNICITSKHSFVPFHSELPYPAPGNH